MLQKVHYFLCTFVWPHHYNPSKFQEPGWRASCNCNNFLLTRAERHTKRGRRHTGLLRMSPCGLPQGARHLCPTPAAEMRLEEPQPWEGPRRGARGRKETVSQEQRHNFHTFFQGFRLQPLTLKAAFGFISSGFYQEKKVLGEERARGWGLVTRFGPIHPGDTLACLPKSSSSDQVLRPGSIHRCFGPSSQRALGGSRGPTDGPPTWSRRGHWNLCGYACCPKAASLCWFLLQDISPSWRSWRACPHEGLKPRISVATFSEVLRFKEHCPVGDFLELSPYD